MKNGFFNIFKKREPRAEVIHARPDASGQAQRTVASLIDDRLINETVNEWFSSPEPPSSRLKLDRVLTQAMDDGLITVDDVAMWSKTDALRTKIESTGTLLWRDVIQCDPWRSLQMQRIAARVYGFRSILICQMSTLVLADMMAPKLSSKVWDQMYEVGLAPVVEHGNPPMINGRIVCVSKDPSSRTTRSFVNSISEFNAELAYADAPIVKGMLDMVAQHVPAIGAAVYTTRPTLQKVPIPNPASKRAA